MQAHYSYGIHGDIGGEGEDEEILYFPLKNILHWWQTWTCILVTDNILLLLLY